jgi:hypothetical protein
MLPSLILAVAFTQNCAINTGLDPACPVTSVNATQSTTVLSSTATQHADTLSGSIALQDDEQIDLALPLYESLGVAGSGDAYGTGDVGAGFSRVVVRRKRIAHVLGLDAAFATGAPTFTNGRTQLAPFYAASYALGGRVSLVAVASYRFDAGGTTLPYGLPVQRFSFVPRAIVDLSKRGWYLAADIDGQSVSGDERFQEYSADGTVGIAARRFAVSLTYREPIATYTWHQLYRHELLWRLSLRP